MSRVLWNVVETHLDEGACIFSQWCAAMDSPRLRLSDVARGPERRLFAHVHGLRVGGDEVFERVLMPLLDAPNRADPDRLSVAVMVALLQGKRNTALAPVLWDWGPTVREATVRACRAVADPVVDRWACEVLTKGASPDQVTSLLELVATRRVPSRPLLSALHGDKAALLCAASRAARRPTQALHAGAIDHLLDHDDADVRDEALVTSLCLGSPLGQRWCRQLARSQEYCTPQVLELLALAGGPADHETVVDALRWKDRRPAAIRALGLSGNVEVVEPLLGLLEGDGGDDDSTARLAGEALSLITGIDLDDPALQDDSPSVGIEQEAADALPSLWDDDLEANLVPGPERELPRPAPAAVRTWWGHNRGRFSTQRRYLAGVDRYPHGVLHQLEKGRMRHRHALALSLELRTGGRRQIATRARTDMQRTQLDALVCALPQDPAASQSELV
ncbi:MAG: hypothetical protein K0V04_08805, partial [Deltaproteobacteria bacterium]|nr:hypothetical protein [Deltaproteobacteria bacterium]